MCQCVKLLDGTGEEGESTELVGISDEVLAVRVNKMMVYGGD